MFTTTENRNLTSNIFGWLAVVVGSVASLAVVAALVFRAVHGLDRQSDGALAFATVAALLALIVGGLSGCYSWLLRRGRLGVLAVVLCIVPVAICLVIRWVERGQSY
jgi:hypothetical protein